MEPNPGFDLSDTGSYYTFHPDDLTYTSVSKEWAARPNLRTTVQQLFECLKSAKEGSVDPLHISDKLKNLADFSHTLEVHLEEKIEHKYPLIGKLIVAFQVRFGKLSTLKKLETQFSDLYNLQQSSFSQQINAFLKANPLDDVVNKKMSELRARSRDPVAEKIVKRYDQLAEVKKEAGLTNAETLKMAYFIECRLPTIRRTAGNHFKRQKYEIPRSVIHDSKTGDVYILLKHKVTLLDASGANKKVTAAVRLPLLQQATTAKAQLMAQSVTKDRAGIFEREGAKAEYAIQKRLNGMAGIWDVSYCTEYTTTKNNVKIEKVTTFTRLADDDLFNCEHTLTFDERLSVTKQLMQGLLNMQQAGIVHWDIKRENALIRKVDGVVTAGWTDFGWAFEASQKPSTQPFVYGTPIYTAPEILTGKKTGYTKTDVWAFGCALYEGHFQQNVPWATLLTTQRIDNTAKSSKFHQLIAAHVEAPLRHLLQKSPRTKEDEFMCLMYQMLRENPADRIDMKRALQEIERIQKL